MMYKFKKGSGIHIKKENKGKFTDYCGGKVTQECISKGKNSSNPVIRKRATFAANVRKWKHKNGGSLLINKYLSGSSLTKTNLIEIDGLLATYDPSSLLWVTLNGKKYQTRKEPLSLSQVEVTAQAPVVRHIDGGDGYMYHINSLGNVIAKTSIQELNPTNYLSPELNRVKEWKDSLRRKRIEDLLLYDRGEEVINGLSQLTLPSNYVGLVMGNEFGEGVGNEAANLAMDFLIPTGKLNISTPLINTLKKYSPRVQAKILSELGIGSSALKKYFLKNPVIGQIKLEEDIAKKLGFNGGNENVLELRAASERLKELTQKLGTPTLLYNESLEVFPHVGDTWNLFLVRGNSKADYNKMINDLNRRESSKFIFVQPQNPAEQAAAMDYYGVVNPTPEMRMPFTGRPNYDDIRYPLEVMERHGIVSLNPIITEEVIPVAPVVDPTKGTQYYRKVDGQWVREGNITNAKLKSLYREKAENKKLKNGKITISDKIDKYYMDGKLSHLNSGRPNRKEILSEMKESPYYSKRLDRLAIREMNTVDPVALKKIKQERKNLIEEYLDKRKYGLLNRSK